MEAAMFVHDREKHEISAYALREPAESDTGKDKYYVVVNFGIHIPGLNFMRLDLSYNEALVLQKILNREINSIKRRKLRELKHTKTKSKRKGKQS